MSIKNNKQNIKDRKDIFISYKNTKIEFVRNLFNELKEHEISAWYDKNGIPDYIGEEYTLKIQEAIMNSNLFLLIYTKDIEDNTFILQKEIQYAIDNGKKILIYPYDKVDFKSMKSELLKKFSNIQWLTGIDNIKYIEEFKEALHDENKKEELATSINKSRNKYTEFDDQNIILIRIEIQKILHHPTPFGTYTKICGSKSIYDEHEIKIFVNNKALFIPIPKSKKEELTRLEFIKDTPSKNDKDKEIDNLWNNLDLDYNPIYNQLINFIKKYQLIDIYHWLEEKWEFKLPEFSKFSITEFINIVSLKVADDFINNIKVKKRLMFNGAMLGVHDIFDKRSPNVEEFGTRIYMYHSDYFTFKCTVEIYHILRSIQDHFLDININNINEYSPFLCSLGMGGFLVINQDNHLNLMWTKRSDAISSGDMWHFSYDETVSLQKDAVRTNGINGKEGSIIIYKDKSIMIDPIKSMHRGIYEENGVYENELIGNKGIIEIGLIKSDRLELEFLSYASLNISSTSSVAMEMKRYQIKAPDSYLEISKHDYIDLHQSVNKYSGKLITPEAFYLANLLNAKREKFFNNNTKTHKNIRIGRNVKIGKNVTIGDNTLIEDFSYIGDNCVIGKSCKIHRNVFLDEGVHIGNNVKIQNNNSIYNGVTLEDGVFVGTNVSFTNDKYPRSIKEDGTIVTSADWNLETTYVKKGASIGAGAVIRCGIEIGEWSMIGCGTVVVHNVPPKSVIVGNPGKIIKYIE